MCSNRAEAALQTATQIGCSAVPEGTTAELVVVDNTPSRAVHSALAALDGRQICLRLVLEPRPGKSYALNTGIAAAKGSIFVLCDDDIGPEGDWLIELTRPILQGSADLVGGAIHAANSLSAEWMSPLHLDWLGTNVAQDGRLAFPAGANLAMTRNAWDLVSGFDPELGPGPDGLGNAEDTLLCEQLLAAGVRFAAVPSARVTHVGQSAKSAPATFVASARRRGRSFAYIDHHWRHTKPRRPTLRLCRDLVKLGAQMVVQRVRGNTFGTSERDLCLTQSVAYYLQLRKESARPRNYSKLGCRKHAGLRPAAHISPEPSPS